MVGQQCGGLWFQVFGRLRASLWAAWGAHKPNAGAAAHTGAARSSAGRISHAGFDRTAHDMLPNSRKCHHLGHALILAVACRWMRQQQHGTYTWPPLTLAVTYTITAKLMPFPLNTRAKVSNRVWRAMTPDTVIMHAHAARCQAHDPGFFYHDFGGSVQERSFALPHPDILCSCQASQQNVHNHAQPHQGAQFAAAELAVPVEF